MADMQALADATVQVIDSGGSAGSGFHFRSDRLAITNHHVVAQALAQGLSIAVRNEAGDSVSATVRDHSPAGEHDFAILELADALPGTRVVLEAAGSPASRGDVVAFAGFPHGVPSLLAHVAVVSGPQGDLGFHLDGSVNGGNSGGPVVDGDGRLVGIVTQRRHMLGVEMLRLAQEAQVISQQVASFPTGSTMVMMGVDFRELITVIAQSVSLVERSLTANANSGIGIAFHARFVNDRCDALGI